MFAITTHSQAHSDLVDRLGLRVAALLTALALFGPFAAPALAQARASILTPSRDSAAPGATLSIVVNPALAGQQPAGSHLVLRSTRRGGGDVELRIVDWSGNAIRAQIPRNAGVDTGATRLMLLDRRNEVIADSGNRMFRVAAAREVPSEDRTAGGASASTNVPGNGPTSRVPGTSADVASRRDKPDRQAAAFPPVGTRPDVDPRPEHGVPARSRTLSTPGIQVQTREPEIAANEGASERRRPPFLRDQKLSGMDYRRFSVRSVAECHTACSVESECRSWTFRPAQRNNTFDNGDDGPTCFLNSGIPAREYARGYVSGIKPPPPAVAAGSPPPPVVRR
ncbi:MAG: PAN domain-containing protein [Burkholderiaceae bacterium]